MTNEIRWVTHTQKRDESKRENIFMENEIRQYWMGQDVIIGVNMIKILLCIYKNTLLFGRCVFFRETCMSFLKLYFYYFFIICLCEGMHICVQMSLEA